GLYRGDARPALRLSVRPPAPTSRARTGRRPRCRGSRGRTPAARPAAPAAGRRPGATAVAAVGGRHGPAHGQDGRGTRTAGTVATRVQAVGAGHVAGAASVPARPKWPWHTGLAPGGAATRPASSRSSGRSSVAPPLPVSPNGAAVATAPVFPISQS